MLPQFCLCGKPVKFANDFRCEDCWTMDQAKYKVGKPTRVQVANMTPDEERQAKAQGERIRNLFGEK